MTLVTLLLSILVPTSWAQDSDELDLDDLDDDIEFEEPPEKDDSDEDERPTDEEEEEEEEPEELFEDLEGESIDLLEGEDDSPPMGSDTESDYRSAATRLGRLEPDEEMAGWEEYLAKHPDSVFRSRIETRMESLMDELYDSQVKRPIVTDADAMRQEIDFAQAMLLENLNPRTRFQAGFEWGIPTYINLILDYEHQLSRSFSVHGGFRRRYQGWNLELGPRIALIKSARTNTIVSFIGDFRFNTNPSYPAIRPQLAAGTRLGKTDIQIQGGADIEFRQTQGGDPTVSSRIVGGLSVFYLAGDRVGVFGETGLFMKPASEQGAFDGGLFRFNVVTVGMKFFPGRADQPDKRDIEANLGATVPYTQQWWQYHFGSIAGQFNYYL
ncbi:MAG: hypothetical protein KTR31_20400 [Myxococcales bacterium]|nr:hypothetical protein [Myxococcales bacterium]